LYVAAQVCRPSIVRVEPSENMISGQLNVDRMQSADDALSHSARRAH
jgi:hypothetical protein